MKKNIFLLFSLMLVCSCSTYEKKIKDKRLRRDKDFVVSEMEEIFNNDQKPRNYINELQKKEFENKKDIIDSLWRSQKKIDSLNTEALIKITNKYGFPSIKRTESEYPVFLIFHHSLRCHNKKVKKIIDKEFKRGRLPEREYFFIKWHLNGRKNKT